MPPWNQHPSCFVLHLLVAACLGLPGCDSGSDSESSAESANAAADTRDSNDSPSDGEASLSERCQRGVGATCSCIEEAGGDYCEVDEQIERANACTQENDEGFYLCVEGMFDADTRVDCARVEAECGPIP